MHEKDLLLLAESFKRYYFEHFERIPVPDRAAQREFGYQRFGGGMVRHMRVKGSDELRLLLMQNSPSDVYCSNGIYSFPELPMSDKDWKEADLIFDIDAKDLGLPCRKDHTFRRCSSCGRSHSGDGCPRCGPGAHDQISVLCKDCIGGAKKEVEKLMHILEEDLGVGRDSVVVYFSGNEGFHVHIGGTQFQGLGSRERGELADYVRFVGAVPQAFGMGRNGAARRDFDYDDEGGWKGRLHREFFGPKSRSSVAITAAIKEGHRAFGERLKQISPVLGANIDPHVTTDIHRIFRLPGSLNGKSGLAKIPCINLDKFDPGSDACLIDSDEVQVTADMPMRLKLGGRRFGPYNGEAVSVPRFAAAYMVCKGLASAA
ncbi:eukaryotic-type DNA primase, catalytic (small) subunit [Cenarchaeum symbiosum A]|uniref:DNA primase small subunit PriS n=1 Tax=Cenarchaeum symbiosum (strain A) TaxID=414004 RepID=PRIS_CENSY|nr:RecName: Full=DNA primase small subunit PriS [Cenarchaeum symbiosum A]ABK78536.1 eukaryotic-type DNA primase, catalytic (small) subunit [Cenarchaeum symbiosum A]